jgi:hypothetical protein
MCLVDFDDNPGAPEPHFIKPLIAASTCCDLAMSVAIAPRSGPRNRPSDDETRHADAQIGIAVPPDPPAH